MKDPVGRENQEEEEESGAESRQKRPKTSRRFEDVWISFGLQFGTWSRTARVERG